MSVEQLEQSVLKLSDEERRQFAQWFYEHENEIVEPPDNDDIHPDVKAEIFRRRDEALAHPELMEPWDGTMDKARELLNEFRRQKAQPR